MTTGEKNEIIFLNAILKEYDDVEILIKAKTFKILIRAKDAPSLKESLKEQLRIVKNRYIN